MYRRLLLAVLILLMRCDHAAAAPAYVERHDGPTNGWNLVPNRHGVKAIEHGRVRRNSPGGEVGAEFLRLTGPPGYSAMLLKPFGQAPVIEDLAVRLRIQTNRPGVLPAVRVVFPRMKDEGTGMPMAAIVRGDSGSMGNGQWEELRLKQLNLLVRRHARVLTGSRGKQVNAREAYIDAVVLILPSGPQGTEVWIDELTIDGLVREAPANVTRQDAPRRPFVPSTVKLTPVGLEVEGKPFYPSIATYNGEPLSEIKKLGFNTIAFTNTPDTSLLAEAAKLKLKVVCPPPSPDALASVESCRAWDPVVLWRLPGQRDARSLDSSTAEVENLRRSDKHLNRPIVAAPTEAWSPWSRLVDGLVVYPEWGTVGAGNSGRSPRLIQAARMAKPGTPLLAVVPTTHSKQYMQQLETFAPAGTVSPWRAPGGVIEEFQAAALSGAMGVWAEGDASLVGGDSHRTRLALALVNLRLMMLGPWLADGARAGELTSIGGAPAVRFSKGRTTLIIPMLGRDGGRSRVGPSYLTPGVAESVKAYELSSVGVHPIGLSRVTGGAHTTLTTSDAMLLLTDDQRAVQEIRRRQAAVTQRGLAIEQALAVAELRHAESHLSPLAFASRGSSPDAAALNDARRWVSYSKTAQSSGDLAAAYRHAITARRKLEAWAERRVAAANPAGGLDSSPLSGEASTVIDHVRLLKLVEPLTRGENLLPGGDFEDQASAGASGWRHIARETTAAPARVEFSGRQPASGERSLRIECPAGDSPEQASVVIRSPEVNLDAGQLVEVLGQVRVESATGDGALVISDSIGGDELSLRVDRQTDWRPFRLLRRPGSAGPVTVAFRVQGPITVSLDAVMIRPIELPSAAKAAVLGAPALQRK